MNKFVAVVLSAIASAAAPTLAASQGISETQIVFGQSAAIEGPAQALGNGMRLGISAAFEEANRGGGIHQRKLKLITLNDGYEPEAAIENTKRLISADKVFALIGSVGTPTSRVSEPIASAAGVPFIGPFTGAEFLRTPYRPTVINVRASYFQETEAIVDRLRQDLNIRRIAVLYQDDSYGQAGLAGVRKALQKRNLRLVSVGTYIRNTTAVKAALLTILDGNPEAVIIIGAYQPSAIFTKWARKLNLGALMINISFVGSTALAASLGPAGKGVAVSQVVPFPEDDSMPLVRDYLRALKLVGGKDRPDFVSLEGYLVGRVTIAALRRAGRELTRESFLKVFSAAQSFDLGGVRLTYGPSDNQGLDKVFLTMIGDGGRFLPITRFGTP
jgi:branched-chain amino acid transport system substrate-binding protein